MTRTRTRTLFVLAEFVIGGMAMMSPAFADAPFDPTFAGNGLLPYLYLFGDDTPAYPSAIAIDSSNRIVVATTLINHTTHKDEMAVTRHIASPVNSLIIIPSSDGLPDTTFGSNGLATGFTSSDTAASATAIAVDHQNRIVVAGGATGTETCSGTATQISYYVAVRVLNDKNSGGQADSSFGSLGIAFYGDCDHNTSGAGGLVIDKDDKVLAVGSTWIEATRNSTLVRWTTDGQLDTDFGTGGIVNYGVSGNNTAGIAIALDPNEKILAAIETATSENIVGSLLRYTAEGSLDATFGTNGAASLGIISSGGGIYPGHLCCIAIDTHGRPVVAGVIVKSTGGSESFEQTAFVARFTTSGTLDTSFGQKGFVYLRNDEIADISGLVIDHHDRVTMSGNLWTIYVPGSVASMVQLNVDGTLNRAVGFDGIYAAEFGYGSWATSLLLDPLGRQTLTSVASDGSGQQVPTLIRFDSVFGDGFD